MKNPDPNHFPGARNVPDEETELIAEDPAERAVPGREMDAMGESGDRDPLMGSALGDVEHGHTESEGEDGQADVADQFARDTEAGRANPWP